jgi:hypothetical protein
VVAEPIAPTVIEITAVPASVALKRIQIPQSAPAPESAPAAQVETSPSLPAPKIEEQSTMPPQAPAPVEPATLSIDATPRLRRLPLDLPTRESAPAEPHTPSPDISTTAWRLAQAEPIDPAPAPQPAPIQGDDTPSMIARRVHVDHLPGERMICGALPRAGVVVMIEDPHGENSIVYSGTAPQYGEGGFEMAVAEDGKYIVTIGGRGIEIQVQGDTVFINA